MQGEKMRLEALRLLVVTQLSFDEAKSQTPKIEVPREAAQRNIEGYLSRMNQSEARMKPAVRRILEGDALIDVILMREGLVTPTIPPGRVREFYEKNKMTIFRDNPELVVRTMLITAGATGSQYAARERIEDIRNQLLYLPSPQARSIQFQEIAKKQSEDLFAEEGGLMNLLQNADGFIPQRLPNVNPETGQTIFPPPIITAIANFTRGDELSRPVMTEMGAHLLYCEKMRGGQVRPFDGVKDSILGYLHTALRQEYVNRWLRKKYKRSLIFWNDNSTYELEDLIPPRKSDK
jgi:hypothetical protein